jgi:hypothetical protein
VDEAQDEPGDGVDEDGVNGGRIDEGHDEEPGHTAADDDLVITVVDDPAVDEPTAQDDRNRSAEGEQQAGPQDAPEEDAPVREDVSAQEALPVRDGERLNHEVLRTVEDTVVAMEVPGGLVDIERFLADQDPPAGEGVGSSAPVNPGDTGPRGATARTAPEDPTIGPGGQIDGDQGERRSGIEGPESVLPAIQARRAAGASTRKRVADHWAKHPKASVREMVQALNLSESTVKRYRRELRELRARSEQSRGGERS